MKVLPNLTGLRFVLAFLVVIFHIPEFCKNRGFPFFNNLSILNKGQEAVYVFFSLSGFLIIRQLYIEKSTTNTINLISFYKRRILRIFPLYYLILSFGLIYYRLILPSFGFYYQSNYDLLEGILLSYTFFCNIFAVYNPGGIIEILWSISIEEQFYLLIAPLLFLVPNRYIKRFLFVFSLVYFTFYFSEKLYLLKEYQMLFFYFSFSGLCSILMLNDTVKLHKYSYLFLLIFTFYFATPYFRDYLDNVFYHFFSMVLFGLTISSLSVEPMKLLENKTLKYLGKISYGIYMYHAIMIQFVGFLFLKLNSTIVFSGFYNIIIFNLLVFIFTIITAHLSYKYFESYFLNLKKNSLVDLQNRNKLKL